MIVCTGSFLVPPILRQLNASKGPHAFRIAMSAGPQMVAGPELAEAASQALGTKLEFKSITEAQAKKILSSEQGEELDDGTLDIATSRFATVLTCILLGPNSGARIPA